MATTETWFIPTLLRLFRIKENIPLTDTLKENIQRLNKLDKEDLLRTLRGTQNPELIQYLEDLLNK